MNNKKIPEGTISRLFMYLRELSNLSKMNIRRISSLDLGERLSLSDTQVRKDLGYFGQFGVSGSGYKVEELESALKKILGKDKIWNVCVVGVGYLGSALLSYPGFSQQGLDIVAAFDNDPKKVSKEKSGILIESIDNMADIIKAKNISIAVITIPAAQAQSVADSLIVAGIRCIMNFAPININVPDDVKINNVDLSRELETLSYFLANPNNANNGKR